MNNALLSKRLRIAHLSDLHFASISYNPLQFFSKRWLGNTNLILFRKKTLLTKHLDELPQFLKSLGVDRVCLTGDVATTSLAEEFQQAAAFASALAGLGLPLHIIPGNHDVYTRGSERSQRFYSYFPNAELASKRVVLEKMGAGWWWVGLDSALATSLISSRGKFFKEMEAALIECLQRVPANDKVIIGNHFPLFGTGNPRHDLARCEPLQKILRRWPQVAFYLHGHDHTPYIIDRTKEGFPLVLNSGSCSVQDPYGTFYLLDLEPNKCQLQRFAYKSAAWTPEFEKKFVLS